jgi:hypothetical protein
MAHNGKQIHGNMWFLDSSRDWPFMNILKMCRNWYSKTLNAWITPDMLSAKGYPISLAGMTGIQCSVTFPSQSRRPGNWVLKWEGYGNFGLNLGVTVFSGSLNATDGRVVFVPTGAVAADGSQSIQLQINGIDYPASPIESIIICHEDDEEALDNGSIFTQDFLDKVSNFGSLRFIDWMATVAGAITKWEHRKPVDYWSYVADESRSALWAGYTTRSGSDYTIASFPGFVLEDKAVVMVTFNEAGPATLATIEIAGTGRKNLLGYYAATMVGTNFAAGSTACLIFDEALDGYITIGGLAGYTFGMSYLRNYVPIEIIVELCNQIGAHPWLHVNYLALDPLTDYAAGLATYCKDNLDAGLIPRFEPSNEVWNSALGFHATRYAWAKATIRWPASSFDAGNWYGMVVSTMGEAIETVYENDRTKYCVISATQPTLGGVEWVARMESTRWVADGGDPAYEHATHWAFATYWGGRYFEGGGRTTTTELELAYQYEDGDAAAKAAALDAYVVLRADGDIQCAGGNLTEITEAASAFAATYDLGLLYYEGGFAPDELSGNVSRGITGVTKSGAGLTNTILQMAVGNVNGMQTAGRSVTISGVVGMTELNGNTYTISSIDDTLGRMTIDVDSSGFTNYTSGGSALYVGSRAAINPLRRAAKWEASIYDIELLMFQQSAANGEFPAAYMLCGANSPYSIFDPTIWDAPTPRWQAILDFNADSEAIAITSCPGFVQRAVGTTSGPLVLSGTYSGGTPAGIEGRIRANVGGATVVDWTALTGGSIAAGAWSGTISIPQGGEYLVDVRWSDAPTATDTSSVLVCCGIGVVLAGQSNMNRPWVDSGPGSESPQLLTRKFYGAYDYPSLSPNDIWDDVDNAFCRKLANDLYLATGIPIGIASIARSATPANYNHNNGGSGWTNITTVVTPAGGDFEIICWHQGESGSGTNNMTMTQAMRRAHEDLSDLFGRTTSQVKFVYSTLGRETSSETAANNRTWWNVKIDHEHSVERLLDMTLSHSNMEASLADNIHFATSYWATFAQRYARTIAVTMGLETGVPAWHIASAQTIDSTTTDVTLTHSLGTDFTPTSGITGFEVSGDNGLNYVNATGVRVSSTKIRLTHDAVSTTSARLMRYHITRLPNITGIVKDNSAYSSPLCPAQIRPSPLLRMAVPTFVQGAYITGNPSGTASLSDIDLGASTDSDKLLTIYLGGDLSSAPSTPVVTPSGGAAVTVTRVVEEPKVTYGSLYMYVAQVPGATQLVDIDITSSTHHKIAVWSVPVDDVVSTTPYDTASDRGASVSSLTVSPSTPEHGVMLVGAVSGHSTLNDATAWDASTEDFYWRRAADDTATRESIADASNVSASASNDVTYTYAGTMSHVLVGAVVWESVYVEQAVVPDEGSGQRPAGSNKRRKDRKYVLEMNNKMYQVSSLDEARAILQSQPVQKKNKTLKLPKLSIELGEISRVKVNTTPLVKALTMNVPLDWIEDAIQRMEDDEEEAVLLLLH